MTPSGAILLCGSARPTLTAIAGELVALGQPLLMQCAPGELAAAERWRRGAGRSTTVRLLSGRLGGDTEARRLTAQAWKRQPDIATLVLCPRLPAAARSASPNLTQWQDGIASGLREPFFVAKHAGLRLAHRGGRLIFAIGAPPGGAGPLAAVVHEGLLCMIEALAKALPKRVAVDAVVGRADGKGADAARTARAVRHFVESGEGAGGALLDLAGPLARG